jgi:hypothetical protein
MRNMNSFHFAKYMFASSAESRFPLKSAAMSTIPFQEDRRKYLQNKYGYEVYLFKMELQFQLTAQDEDD